MRFGDDDGIEVEALEPPSASGGQLIETGGGPGRVRTIALVVAAVALLGGVVAFAGRDSSTSGERSSDTRPTATTRDRSATSTTIDDGRPTTTTVPATTTTLPSVIGPLLDVPSGLRIAVADDKNRLLRIDLDTGTVEVLPKRRGEAAYEVSAQGEWIVWQGENGSHTIAPDGTEVESVDSDFGGPLLDSDGSTFWSQQFEGRNNAIVRLDRPGGAEIGEPFDIPQNAYLAGVVAGHPIVWVNGGGTYALGLDGESPLRLGIGAPAALGGGAVILDECDESMRCVAVLVDVTTGKRSDVADPIGGLRGFFGGQSTSISPDRRYFAGAGGFDGNLITVNDLQTGNEVMSKSYQYPENGSGDVRWSKDGKWLVWLSGQDLFVWSSVEPHSDPVVLKLPIEVRSFDLIDHA